MRFSSEDTRLEHPYARLIPRLLWAETDIFNSQISEEALAVMPTDLPSIDEYFLNAHTWCAARQLEYWICLLLGHPETSIDDLLHTAHRLSLPASIIFKGALFINRLDIADKIDVSTLEIIETITADKYRVFIQAARLGQLNSMVRLTAIVPEQKMDMIKTINYGAFIAAAAYGHLDVLNWLKAEASDQLQAMIAVDNYRAFLNAARSRNLEVLDWLKTESPGQLQAMIEEAGVHAFNRAANSGKLLVLNWLKANAPGKINAMISFDRYSTFRTAAENGHLAVLDWLKTEAPDKLKDMIRANCYGAFRYAAENGHLDVLNWLEAEAPDQLQAMIVAEDQGRNDFSEAFSSAFKNSYLDVVKYLLSLPTCFASAEMHEREYSSVTHSFITDKLTFLRNQRVTIETGNPHAVFDITDARQAKLCFYMIRNLIRRNDPGLLDDIRFLLGIPAVKALAHVEVTAGQPNELVCLALTTGNQDAAGILLTIPAVRELARHHHFYLDEAGGRLDLAALARDHESSMRALTTGEQERFAAASARYQPMMQEASVGHLFDQLRDELKERFQLHPATIKIDGIETKLPVDWEAFSSLDLTAVQRDVALKAYYQHKDHTALRYLSIPNHWMATDASYVYINEARTERWSTFEEYKQLIVMLWLAANDVTVPPTDGHMLEGRLEHFIDELAQIGRAHNWDDSRSRVGSHSREIEEEYDDLKGDKPSCFSGVKRRLFQSVVGHPLLKILTGEDIIQELRDFVRGHFSRLINDENREILRTAWENYCASLELPDAEHLRTLNINLVQQAAFIEQLTTKYGQQYSGDAKFKRLIEIEFTFTEGTTPPADSIHALRFSGLVNLCQLLQVPAAVGAGTFVANPHTLFAGLAPPAATSIVPSAVGFNLLS